MFYPQFFRASQSYVRCFLLVALSLLSFSVFSIQPSPKQIEHFKRMSPGEQSRLAQQFGVAIPQGQVAKATAVIQTDSVMHKDSDVVESEQDAPAEIKFGNKQGGLVPFGYGLFSGQPTTFAPVTDIPVSSDYVLGPGDSLKVNLYGKESQFFELMVDQEGQAYIPDLGPMNLAGLSFAEAKVKINNIIDQKMIGVKASISMGQLRSIRVFVLGEAKLPGSYVVSSLSTMTNALVLSGGVSTNGSLRNIQLKRRGKLIQTIDLYDLLLKGDTASDAQLKSGDVVFIPPVGLTAGIRGEVRRPAIYEVTEGQTLNELITLAGGLLSSAHPNLSKVKRVGEGDKTLLLDVDLEGESKHLKVLNGDDLYIPASLGILNGVVSVGGEVLRPGMQAWEKGVRLLGAIELAGLTSNADLQYGLIKRYEAATGEVKLLPFSLSKIMQAPNSELNVLLNEQDELFVFGLYKSTRKSVIASLIEELRAQASIQRASREAVVSGDVRYPGVYPLVDGMSVEHLVQAAGGLTEKAFKLRAELTRIEFNDLQERQQSRFELDLTQSSSLEFVLKSRDELQVKTIPNWSDSEKVTLSGEVKFPGEYRIYKNDTLADVISRAGGVTESAYVAGAVFTRVDLKVQQEEQLADMQKRLADEIVKADLVSLNGDVSEGVDEAERILDQLKKTQAIGRLVIDLNKVLASSESYSIPLLAGDKLHVPIKKNSVTVIGEVQLPISQIYEEGLGFWDYVDRSGGVSTKADSDRAYVIKASGAVEQASTASWFSNQREMSPGDTIVVPLDTDKFDDIVLWRDMTQIMYQIALAVAAVGSL